jgi:3-oxoadipate enol-lactonase
MALHYVELAAGDAETVVLLHSLALDATIWADFAAGFADGIRIVAPDLPGHGRSPGSGAATVESMADAVADLVVSVCDVPVTLIGMSLGGSVAQAVAIRHSQLVARLGLVDTTAWYGPNASATWAERSDQAQREGLPSLADFQLERWFTNDFRARRPELGEQLLEIFRQTGLDDYVRSCTALGAMDLRSQLGAIQVPTAIVVGELDRATPPAHAEALSAAIAGSTMTVVPDCKHLSALERPADVRAALAPILASVA